MCQNPDGFAKVARLAILSLGVFKHAHNETELTEQAMFPRTVGLDVGLCKLSYRGTVMQDLYQRVGVAVHDMCL